MAAKKGLLANPHLKTFAFTALATVAGFWAYNQFFAKSNEVAAAPPAPANDEA
mgnify:CR=1 FL=1